LAKFLHLYQFCVWYHATSLGQHVSQSLWLFPTIETVHIIGLAFVVGAIARLDLRLLGVSKHLSVTAVARSTMPWAWAGAGIAIITGVLLFSSNAENYYRNSAFRYKMLMLALIAVNTLIYEVVTRRNIDAWDVELSTPVGARLAAVISFTLWIGVIAAGRWIAYV